jgi:hypothetical protein
MASFDSNGNIISMVQQVTEGVGLNQLGSPTFNNITMADNGHYKASVQEGLTAHAGGGQSGATALTADLCRVTTVGTAADSVVLPVAAPGMEIVVINAAAANSMNVFPASGDAINALSANAAFAVAAGKTCSFFSTLAGHWHTLLTA